MAIKILTNLMHKVLDDRYILREVIFPYFIPKNEFSRILFVGCKWYTRNYNTQFQQKDYWTLDVDQRQRKHGAKQHITDTLENIDQHFAENSLDLIVCNGVFGWGLDEREDVEKAFRKCYQCLRAEGVFILGWNDIAKRRPFPLEECQALNLFDKYKFPPLSTSEYLTKTFNRHKYYFYVKR